MKLVKMRIEWTLNPMIRVLVRGEKGKPEAGQRGGGQVTMKTGAGECSREHGEPQELVEAGRTLISGRGNKPDIV